MSEIPRAVAILGELLSRPKLNIQKSILIDYPEQEVLNAMLETKFETAVIAEDTHREIYLMIIYIGSFVLLISTVIYIIYLWHPNYPLCSRQSDIDLSVTDTTRCHEEEKSNNLQNEENFRRYANPLKNSAISLRSSNVELSPIQDLPGPSGLNQSQTSIFKTSNELGNEFEPSTKAINSQSLYKTQNSDVDKNTIQAIESSSKDFDKRINKVDFKCFSASASATTPLTNYHNSSSSHTQQPINNLNSNDTLTLHI